MKGNVPRKKRMKMCAKMLITFIYLFIKYNIHACDIAYVIYLYSAIHTYKCTYRYNK